MLIVSLMVSSIMAGTLITLPATSIKMIIGTKWILTAMMINYSTNYQRKNLQNISDTKFAKKVSIPSCNFSSRALDVTIGHIKFQPDLPIGRKKKHVRLSV